jgi:nucleoside-diphosphate-sugar epimerase
LAATLRGAPADMFLNNVVATRNLLEAMAGARSRARLVHCSSFSVYGAAELGAGELLDERAPLEPHPDERDIYAQTKLRQEALVWDYFRDRGIATVVLRPGVVYGPGCGAPISSRVGVTLGGVFLRFGRRTVVPLTYVDNCAEALVCAAERSAFCGEVYNVVDDDLVTAAEFLRRYRREVAPLPYIPVPYSAALLLSWAVARYSARSCGQLPAIFTPYKTRSQWRGHTYCNRALKAIGWRPPVATAEGLRRHFADLRASL